MRRGLIIADMHLLSYEKVHPSYELVKRFAKDFKPDFVVIDGDMLDLPYFSKFDRDNLEVQAKGNWENDVKLANTELDFWQRQAKDLYFRQGNHEFRLEVAAGEMPKMADSLDLGTRLGFRDRGIRYTREIDAPIKFGKLSVTHGWYYNIHHAKKTLMEYGGSIVYAHVHKFQSYSKVLQATSLEIQAWSIGCLCDKQPEYVRGRPTGHQNGFGIINVADSGNFNFYPVNVTKWGFIWDKHEYRL